MAEHLITFSPETTLLGFRNENFNNYNTLQLTMGHDYY